MELDLFQESFQRIVSIYTARWVRQLRLGFDIALNSGSNSIKETECLFKDSPGKGSDVSWLGNLHSQM